MSQLLTKEQSDYYLRRCYAALEDEDVITKFRLRLMEKFDGLLNTDGSIDIDPRGPVLSTVLHELLHEVLGKDTGESVVLRFEKEMSKHMSARQWTNLMKRSAEVLYR